MAVRGVLGRSFNLRSRARLRKSAQTKVTPKKGVSADPTEKSSDRSKSRDAVARAESTRRQLRPRKVVEKNTIEEAFKRSSKNSNRQTQQRPKERKSTIELKKTDKTNKKLPIYKQNIDTEKSLEDQNSVYEFPFDPNDRQEKITKKKQKKRNTNKKNTTKDKKKPNKIDKKKPTNIQTRGKKALPYVILTKQKDLDIENAKKQEHIKIDTKKPKNIQIPRKEALPDIILAERKEDLNREDAKKTENIKIDMKKQTNVQTPRKEPLPEIILADQKDLENDKTLVNTKIDMKKPMIIQAAEENSSPRGDTILAEQNKTSNKSTPRIISVENADTIIVNRLSNASTENFRSPLRPRNVFDNTIVKQQRKDSSNYSSLTEFLSPISNIADTINIGSPWRPPMFPMPLSRAKHFAQSTPKVNSKTNNKLVAQEKENNQATKKKALVKENKPAADSKMLVEQENRENILVEDEEHCQVTGSKVIGEDEHLVKDKKEDNVSAKQENEHLMEYLKFSDTFDVLSDTERLSTFGTEIRLFEDIEPTHFLEPPKRLYKRKRGRGRLNFLEESDREGKENKENAGDEKQTKKKKHKKDDKRINEWIRSVNNSFQEIDNYDLLIE